MTEVIRAVQWNIGGGKIMDPACVPPEGALIKTYGPYDIDGLDTIIGALAQTKPDIITLNETHENNRHSQTADIADALGLPYWVNDTYGESHIDPDYQLGQAIISRFPLGEHEFRQFTNPSWRVGAWTTELHKKGVTSAVADTGTSLLVETLHAVPFKVFGVDQASARAKPVLDDLQAKILARHHPTRLLQGDFNLHCGRLTSLLPKLFAGGLQEITQIEPTTPFGYMYDHVLYAGLTAVKSSVVKMPTDHYPIVSEFACR